MKNYDIDRILKPAFKLFLTYNYEAVSIIRLEEAIGLTRGAIYYKHKSKEILFQAVIDRYVLNYLDGYDSSLANISLKKFISRFLSALEKRMEELRSLGVTNIHRGYFNLLYQALQYYPSFDKKIQGVFDDNLKLWTEVIQHAIETGEVKSDCKAPTAAQNFRFLYTGMAFEHSLSEGLNFAKQKKAYREYYKEIAIEDVR